MSDDVWTVARTLRWMRDRFTELELDSPRLDAELLLAETLGCDRLGVVTRGDQPLSEHERLRLRELIKRRQQREPVAYILGRKGFADVELAVGPGVLVPRPETEFVIDVCRELAEDLPDGDVVDLGTGSGALAIVLQRLWPRRRVLAIERSADALAYARRNVTALAPTVDVRAGDWCAGLSPASVALAVSNPPYVAEAERNDLAPELAHEPETALFAGPEGLRDILHLASALKPVLTPGGRWVCEVGRGQRPRIDALLRDAGWDTPRWQRDYGGVDRVFAAKIKS